MLVTVRPYVGADWDAVLAITRKSFRNTHDEAYLRSIVDDPRRVVSVATKRKRVVGFAVLRVQGQAYLDTIAVASQWRRSGVGGRLMSAVEEQARKRGSAILFLDMHAKGPLKWYQKRGFTVARKEGLVLFKDGTRSALLAKGLYWGQVVTAAEEKKSATAAR